MHFYLGASALAKRYAPEAGSMLVDHLLSRTAPDRLHLFNLSIGEVVSLLVRKRNQGRLPAADFRQAFADLLSEMVQSSVDKLTATTRTVIDSLVLIEQHSINSTDAIILQTALELAKSLRQTADDLSLVTSDKLLVRAAGAEGLATFDPETQSQADLDALIGP